MKIILEREEALAIIHSVLCNGGLSELSASGVDINIEPLDYALAKDELIALKVEGNSEEPICREDIWVQILRGGKKLQFFDHEEEEWREFFLEKAIEEMSKEEVLPLVLAVKEEQDDALTGWELLQYFLYGEVIFG